MALTSSFSWKKIRGWLLGSLILLFVAGVGILFSTGNHTAPVSHVAVSSTEDFGKYLIDHYDLLEPFFDQNHEDIVGQGVPLLLQVMGDIILLNMAIEWVLDVGIAYGFSFMFAPLYTKPQHALIYASWRLGLDIIVFMMFGLGSFGLEQIGSFIPVGLILIVFIIIDILVQSFLVANVYGTGAALSTMFYISLVIIHLLVGALVTGTLIKKRVAVMLAQFVDVQAVTVQLEDATAKSRHDLDMANGSKEEAAQFVSDAQNQLARINQDQEDLRKDIEAKQNSEPYVYSRIIRIRAQGDLTTARDQLTAFMTKFPSGVLINTAKAQLDLINQDLASHEAQKKQAEADAEAAVARARADLLARASRGEVTLSEMRRVLVGKAEGEVLGLFGPPSETASNRWGYGRQMIVNDLTGEKSGLAVYFTEGKVQGVDYYFGQGGNR